MKKENSLISGEFVGRLKPVFRSAIEPALKQGPVQVVVANTWDQFVQDATKDVLILLYSAMAPQIAKTLDAYRELATQITDKSAPETSSAQALLVAKMDLDQNDLPDPGYLANVANQSALFFKSRSKNTPLRYKGPFELAELLRFVEEAIKPIGKIQKEEKIELWKTLILLFSYSISKMVSDFVEKLISIYR